MQDLLVDVLRGTGATVVFVTHDVDEALFLGDRVALLGAGRLLGVREVPRPRDRAAHDDPARVALRRTVLESLGDRREPATAPSAPAGSSAPLKN
jgi:NitT/TauT family transport system ATP-binding protein